MQKRPPIWLTLLLCLLLPAMAACGAQPSSPKTPPVSVAPGEMLYVLDGYSASGAPSAGNQRLLAFHPGAGSASAQVSLPAGLTSLDHQRLYVATPQGTQTEVKIFDTKTGATLGAFPISGVYSTGTRGYETGALSPDGRWLALRQVASNGSETVIALVDTQARKLVKTEHLSGDFDLDAISPNGQMLYVLQYTNDAEHHYYVRAYHLATDQLDPTIIVDKTEVDEKDMQGQALTRQMAPDGSMAYTLYINQQENKAFVHILPVLDQPDVYFARCIDLPVGTSPDVLPYYTLALSPDGTTLYAANTALGVVTTIVVQADYVFNIKPGTTRRFHAAISSVPAGAAHVPYNGAVVSPDQRTLYVAGIDGIWALSVLDMRVLGHYLTNRPFTSVALSADGRTLYAVSPTQGVFLFNLTNGQSSQMTLASARSPWAIAWVSK